MTTNGAAQHGFAPVLAALATLQSNLDRSQKAQAHEFLESFQKSPEAWTITISILQSSDATVEARLFAATTLKGKITFDLHQLPRESLPSLKDTLLSLMSTFGAGPKPIRTQLCVCLARLAIQMTEWKDVLQQVVSSLGNDPKHIASVLEFLHVLPEEVTEGRKINLSEDDLNSRTTELLQDNAEQVLQLLTQYSQSSATAAKDPLLLECITSWLREVPMNDIVNSPLLNIIMDALSSGDSFDSAVECLSAIFSETKDVDECQNIIQSLYPRVMSLKPQIKQAADADDAEALRGFTRIFAEAGENWVVLIARMPRDFRGLVEGVLECAACDKEHDSISLTFKFWYEFKQYITLSNYSQARTEYADLFSNLVDVMIGHLQFPKPQSGNETDLFEGDREQEERFRAFRHQMGDVLKDCCQVIGATECLAKPYELIEKWIGENGSQLMNGRIPDWQALEAPLFAMRAMGRMVSHDEEIMLPKLIPLILQIPDHEKVRFQAVMALGRYTEWTAAHPETLQPQLNFIMAAFDHPSKEVVRAAALSFRFFCNDCADLLKDYMPYLQQFYTSVLDRLPPGSQDELTEGVASVLAKQSMDQLYPLLKMTCDPVVQSLITMAQTAMDKESKLALADRLQLITIFIQWIQPYVEPPRPNPAVQYCQEIFPVLARLADLFSDFIPILERVCRCWRHMVLSYRSDIAPLLPELADKLSAGFASSRQGCFLWATGSIMKEFSNGADTIDEATTTAIFQFFEQQTVTFLRALSDFTAEELPDVIEDYYRLASDVLQSHPIKFTTSSLSQPVVSAAASALGLLQEAPLLAILHFLRDLLARGRDLNGYGRDGDSLGSTWEGYRPRLNNPDAVKGLLAAEGEGLTERVLIGMMFTFPADCWPDASGVLLEMFFLLPQEVSSWIGLTISRLPQGSVNPQESQKLMRNINQAVQSNEIRRVRTLLQDFTNSYRRRNVAPREGLGRLEATRFRFNQ